MQIIKELNEDNLKIIKKVIFKDDLVIFPTETVYGIGANALSEKAVERIFAVKERARNNPLIVHLKDKAEIEKVEFMRSGFSAFLRCFVGADYSSISFTLR